MQSKLLILKIAESTSAKAILLRVEAVEGDVRAVRGRLTSPDVPGEWHLRRIYYQPILPEDPAAGSRLCLSGPMTALKPGMHLICEG